MMLGTRRVHTGTSGAKPRPKQHQQQEYDSSGQDRLQHNEEQEGKETAPFRPATSIRLPNKIHLSWHQLIPSRNLSQHL